MVISALRCARLLRHRAPRRRRAPSLLLLLACLVALVSQALQPVRAQIAVGATLTVLRGNVGVLRSDGSPISPASSGLTLGRGDQVATVGRSSALLTFFEGSELELGGDTTIIIRELAQEGQRTTIAIQSVVGTILNRVVTLTDPGSTYRVEAGGTVALVRGTVFGHHLDPAGDITVAVGDGDVEYPASGSALRRGEKRTVTSRGDVVTSSFDPSRSLFTVVTEPAASGNPSGTDNPGIGTGSFSAPQQQSLQQSNERDPQALPSSRPGSTVLIVAAPSGTTRLEVASTDGFAVGDLIRIGSGPSAELGIIVGFGSIILQQPLVGSFTAGTPVELVAHPAPVATATALPPRPSASSARSSPRPPSRQRPPVRPPRPGRRLRLARQRRRRPRHRPHQPRPPRHRPPPPPPRRRPHRLTRPRRPRPPRARPRPRTRRPRPSRRRPRQRPHPRPPLPPRPRPPSPVSGHSSPSWRPAAAG